MQIYVQCYDGLTLLSDDFVCIPVQYYRTFHLPYSLLALQCTVYMNQGADTVFRRRDSWKFKLLYLTVILLDFLLLDLEFQYSVQYCSEYNNVD